MDRRENNWMNERRTKFDRWFSIFLDKYVYYIAVCLLIVLSGIIRIQFMPNCSISSDYTDFILPWITKYRESGIVAGLSQTIGDYYVPYNVVIALIAQSSMDPGIMVAIVSCTAEYIAALFIYKIACLIMKENGYINPEHKACMIAVLTLYLPFVILNGSLWKQCDSIYTCFLVICLYELLKKKYTAAFIFFSIGFCFKLQAIFMLPVLLTVYLVRKDFSILQFLWIPAVYFAAGLPAIVCGRDFASTYGVYINQTGEYGSMMAMGAPNIYKFGLSDYTVLSKAAIYVTMAVIIVTALFCIRKHSILNSGNLTYLCAFMIWSCFMFLPGMHERYDYAAVLMITIYIFASMNRRMYWVPIVLNICLITTYSKFLFGESIIPMPAIAVPYCMVYFIVAFDLKKKLETSEQF